MTDRQAEMRRVALDWLTRRDHSRVELRRKLARRFDPRRRDQRSAGRRRADDRAGHVAVVDSAQTARAELDGLPFSGVPGHGNPRLAGPGNHSNTEQPAAEADLSADMGVSAESLSADIDAVLSWLESYQFIDESRYLAVLLRSALERGHGELRLRQELRQRGLPGELIESALAELSVDWVALAREVRERRFGRKPAGEPKEKARQLRFLQYRGFTAGQCFAALGVESDTESLP